MVEPADTLLTKARKDRGLYLEHVAAAVDTSVATLSKVERGVQIPKRELARALFEYFDGAVPLGAIYDAQYVAPVFVSRNTRRPAGKKKRRR